MAIAYQHVQVPKMKVLNLIMLFWGVGFLLHKPYIGEDSSILGTCFMFGEIAGKKITTFL